ncbi:MAG: PTS glucose transporter subunit IIA [Clostridiales bacterium]|nr:PTS glucose transporter subunit IIA [Clostridiales bacterium]
MFGFLKKGSKEIAAPVSGTCVELSKVNDKAFSSKALGDGFAVVPEEDVVVSPATGEISMIFDTNHAFGVKVKGGVEILVHIGIDTVSLNGEGFTALVKQGAQVKMGDPIIRIAREELQKKGVDLTTMVVFTDGYDDDVVLDCYDQKVGAGQVLIQY